MKKKIDREQFKMKFFQILTLIGTLIIVSTAEDGFADPLLKMLSNKVDLACKAVGNAVSRFPLNEPNIEKVSFQLRLPCRTIEYPVGQSNMFRYVSQFDPKKRTVVFVAGFFAPPEIYFIADMAKAYNCRGGYNFLLYNTRTYLATLYANTAYNTDKLGRFLAIGLRNLGLPPDRLHIIGHSLGAHIVGIAGRYYYKLTGRKIDRITGLDPARPCFRTPSIFPSLKRGDGRYIDIIHSNPYELGTEEAIGDVDFFAGGLSPTRRGCGINIRCSHEISIQYLVESIYPGNELNFVGYQCDSYEDLEQQTCRGPRSIMGFANGGRSRGIHYVPVRPQSPFGSNGNSDDSYRFNSCGRCKS
ncbi:vitellogenin-1-like [Haematobia irritans]|uniref:vitellogenin-1-like n=1 Tax=Haematobia irritans TaxID=7368 RepID=UPI003F50AD94